MQNSFFEIRYDNCKISTNKALLNIDTIHKYLSTESYWALDIPKQTVERAIENSICFGVYKNDKQIGFARMITDKATFAYLADVFIVKEEQGNGFGKLLMQAIHQHPDLQGLRRLLLTTRDAHTLYEQFGWQRINDDLKSRLMTINKPNIYKENKQP